MTRSTIVSLFENLFIRKRVKIKKQKSTIRKKMTVTAACSSALVSRRQNNGGICGQHRRKNGEQQLLSRSLVHGPARPTRRHVARAWRGDWLGNSRRR